MKSQITTNRSLLGICGGRFRIHDSSIASALVFMELKVERTRFEWIRIVILVRTFEFRNSSWMFRFYLCDKLSMLLHVRFRTGFLNLCVVTQTFVMTFLKNLEMNRFMNFNLLFHEICRNIHTRASPQKCRDTKFCHEVLKTIRN